MADIIAAILSSVFEVIFYATGRVLLPIISGGNWKAIGLGVPARKYMERQEDGTLLFSEGMTGVVGCLFLLARGALILTVVVAKVNGPVVPQSFQ